MFREQIKNKILGPAKILGKMGGLGETAPPLKENKLPLYKKFNLVYWVLGEPRYTPDLES